MELQLLRVTLLNYTEDSQHCLQKASRRNVRIGFLIKTIGVINGNIKYPCVLAHIVEQQRTEKYKIVTYYSRV